MARPWFFCLVFLSGAFVRLGAGQVEETRPQGVLVVTVVSGEGAPLGGARIWAWNQEEFWTARTDSNGRARIEDLPAGTVQVLAAAERHVGDERHDVLVLEGKETALQFTLPPGVPFEGTLLDSDGKALSGESILVEAGGTFEGYVEMHAGRAPLARTRTDAQGRFRVEGIPSGAVATVVVQAEGHETARVAVKAVADGVRPFPLVIRLVRGACVAGRVSSPDGAPVAGARVLVVPADEQAFLENPHIQMQSTDGRALAAVHGRSDEQGRYTVGGLTPGRAVVVCAEAPGFARSAWSRSVSPAPGREETGVDLVLRRPGALVVKVRARGGGPVADANVEVGGFMSGIRSEEGERPGAWRFERLRPDVYEIRVSAPGYLEALRKVELAEGERLEAEIVLEPGVVLAGVIVNPEGGPIAWVRIHAEGAEPGKEGGKDGGSAGSDLTDAQGRFRIAGLRAGRYRLGLAGFELRAGRAVVAPAEDLRIEAIPLGVVRLRLVAPEGGGLPASAWVRRHRGETVTRGSVEIPLGLLRLEGFRGEETVAIDVEGFLRVKRTVAAEPGKSVDLGEIVLDSGTTLVGRVVDSGGRPVTGAEVSHEARTEALTDMEGRFRLPHVPSGRIVLEVKATGFLPWEREVEAGAGVDATLVLLRGALLRGVLKDRTGKPFPKEWLFVQRPRPEGGWVWENDEFQTEEDGSFEVRVAPGRCRIVREGEQEPVVLAVLEAAEGETRRLELVSGPGD